MSVTEVPREAQFLSAPMLKFLKNLFEIWLNCSTVFPDNITSLEEMKNAKTTIDEIEAAIDRKLKAIDYGSFQCLIGLSLYETISTGRKDKIDIIVTLLDIIDVHEKWSAEEEWKNCVSNILVGNIDLGFAIINAIAEWEKIVKVAKENKISQEEFQRMVKAGKEVYISQNPSTLLRGVNIEFKD